MAVQQFSVIVEWDADDDVWVTRVPALDHLSTYGETRQAALEHTREAILGYLVRQPHPVMSRFCRCSQLKHHDRCLCAWGDKKRCQRHLNSDHVLLGYRWRSHIAAAVLEAAGTAGIPVPRTGGPEPSIVELEVSLP